MYLALERTLFVFPLFFFIVTIAVKKNYIKITFKEDL